MYCTFYDIVHGKLLLYTTKQYTWNNNWTRRDEKARDEKRCSKAITGGEKRGLGKRGGGGGGGDGPRFD